MTTKELRDKLILKKAEYQSSLKAMETSCDNIQRLRKSILDSDISSLEENGIRVKDTLNFDLDRCKTDEKYLNSVKADLDSVIDTLHSFLEEELGV